MVTNLAITGQAVQFFESLATLSTQYAYYCQGKHSKGLGPTSVMWWIDMTLNN